MHLLIPVLFITLVTSFFNKGQGDKGQISPRTPISILKERYAKGEIGKEEFSRIKNEIK